MKFLVLVVVMSVANGWRVASPGARLGVHSRQRISPFLMAADDDDFFFGDAGTVSTETVQEMAEEELTEKQKEIERLRAAEKFMKRGTGDAVCRTCNYRYNFADGDGTLPRNTPFDVLPDSWCCPNCKSPKAFFDPIEIELAGFKENQQYGFGTNSMTESGKVNLIFGGLLVSFALLMGGYALN